MDIKIKEAQLNRLVNKLISFGVDVSPQIEKLVDFGKAQVSKHAKGRHFFVGTGAGSSGKAKSGEFKFKNRDGSLRFKIRTGNLVNSIEEGPTIKRGNKITGTVVAGMKYAKAIEEGSPKNRAFPFMRPAVEATRPKFLKSGIKFMKEEIKKFGKG